MSTAPVKRRARQPDDRQARRTTLLDSAAALLASHPWASVTVAAVAEASGLSKPAVFGYYPTREALLLGLLERELGHWLDALDAALCVGAPWSSRRVARAIASTLDGRVVLLRLLARLEGTLEQNVPEDAVRAFKLRLGARLGATGTLLARRLPWLGDDAAVGLLLRVRAVVSGLWQMSDASPVVGKLLCEPALAAMRVDFARELTPCLEALLAGMEALSAG